MKTCETCAFYRKLYEDVHQDIPTSRKSHTPTQLAGVIFTGECRIRSVPDNFFPMRHKDQFCGEHQPKEEC